MIIKIFALVFSMFALSYFAFFQESSREEHNIFFSNREGLYDSVMEDGSFGKNPVFFIISKIPLIARRICLGEYTIKRNETAYSLIFRMFQGDTVVRKITIPEGYTVQMIVEKLNNEDSLSGEITNIPEEGSLFPSTYFYKKNDSKSSIIQKMKTQMDKLIKELFFKKTQNYIRNTIILASIIEKETGIAEEKYLVASVFQNRLRKKMKLQSDPTVVYALSKGYGKIDHPLRRSELRFDSPYNTYKNNGLPPSPICCPSKESLIAVMKPAKTEYLYFVINREETRHLFTKEYSEHLKNTKR